MPETIYRHDISDKHWALLEPHLPGRAGVWGGVARDNRQFINAVFWMLRTGAPWRDLPTSYGDWKNTHRRFCRWHDQGIWESLLEKPIVEKLRHLVENAFLNLKRWRGIATRYAKNLSPFVAAVQIRCLVLWLAIS